MEELASEREAGDSIELDSAGRAQRSAGWEKMRRVVIVTTPHRSSKVVQAWRRLRMFNRESWLSLVPFLVVCFAAAGIGSLATRGSTQTWYPQLRKPEWNPPNWVFGPVWTILYAMMALSAWLVWRRVGWAGAKFALLLFAVQLVLNTGWSVVFFGMHAIGAAFAEMLLWWMMTVATTVAFSSLSFLAAWLLIPYVVWLAFASYLNFRIWQLN